MAVKKHKIKTFGDYFRTYKYVIVSTTEYPYPLI